MSSVIQSAQKLAEMEARLLFFLFLLCAAPMSGAQERCGAGKDLMFQALERVSTGSNAEVENGLQLLKHANALCPTLGDAWYYRSLFEQKLHTQKGDYALSKARLLGSEAMDERLDPFHVAANGPATESKAPAGPPRQKWALVIGIGSFVDARVP